MGRTTCKAPEELGTPGCGLVGRAIDCGQAVLYTGLRWTCVDAMASDKRKGLCMKGEFTAVIESSPEGGYWAICPEVPGANGQGETVAEAKENLKQAIVLILEDRLADIRRGLGDDAIEEKIAIG